MSLSDKFNQAFGFTTTERRVVLFLAATLLAGFVIRIYKSAAGVAPAFDYSASDSEFAARSKLLLSPDSISMDDSIKHTDVPPGFSHAGALLSSKDARKIININTAGKDELTNLPGIGEAMAERIVLYREENGPFTSVRDLEKVKGIGKKKLERIVPYCTIGK